MRIRNLCIKNFKSLQEIHIHDMENALILVGRNSTGKTAVLEIIRAIAGSYHISRDDFRDPSQPITAEVTLECNTPEDLLTFTFIAESSGSTRFEDTNGVIHPEYRELFPPVYCIDTQRNLAQFQKNLLFWMEDGLMKQMRSDCCLSNPTLKCHHCFQCIDTLKEKSALELDAFETARLLDYKLYQLNLNDFSSKLNENFRQNGGQETIHYSMSRDMEQMLSVNAEMTGPNHSSPTSINRMGKGMRSVYMLSLLETYAEGQGQNPGIILVEEPEIFLHPQMQKIAGDILYRLSKKNQVIFTTHSSNLLSNFNTRQIRQMVLNDKGCSKIRTRTNISSILNDLGYSAADLMNVDFVFIVEGKQDRSRLPMLLRKFYSETVDADGSLLRISIISTNSCTNIQTYANLKYINQVYLKDQFLIIRDGDGKDRQELQQELCNYYDDRRHADPGALPQVRPENVLILGYYSFENYFLNPRIMVQVGVLDKEEDFYHIFLKAWRKNLRNITSGQHLREVLGHDLNSIDDVKRNIETIKTYLRGHDLFDLFYGRFQKREQEILSKYVEIAPREEFKDILEAIDHFIYFENRRR